MAHQHTHLRQTQLIRIDHHLARAVIGARIARRHDADSVLVFVAHDESICRRYLWNETITHTQSLVKGPSVIHPSTFDRRGSHVIYKSPIRARLKPWSQIYKSTEKQASTIDKQSNMTNSDTRYSTSTPAIQTSNPQRHIHHKRTTNPSYQ